MVWLLFSLWKRRIHLILLKSLWNLASHWFFCEYTGWKWSCKTCTFWNPGILKPSCFTDFPAWIPFPRDKKAASWTCQRIFILHFSKQASTVFVSLILSFGSLWPEMLPAPLPQNIHAAGGSRQLWKLGSLCFLLHPTIFPGPLFPATCWSQKYESFLCSPQPNTYAIYQI